jgi:hypothetical protein
LIIKRTTPKALRTLRFENNTKGIDYQKAKNTKSYIRIIDKTQEFMGEHQNQEQRPLAMYENHMWIRHIFTSAIFFCAKFCIYAAKKHIYLLQHFFFI